MPTVGPSKLCIILCKALTQSNQSKESSQYIEQGNVGTACDFFSLLSNYIRTTKQYVEKERKRDRDRERVFIFF